MTNFLALATIAIGCLPLSLIALAQQEESSAQQDESSALKDRAAQLVRQLDDRELARRQAAERELIELGPEVLGLLPAPSNRMPAEMRQRLQRIAGALEQVAARSVIQPQLVTLSGSLTLSEALQSLEHQSGNQSVGAEMRDAQLELDLQQTSYWQALDQILDRAELDIDPYGGRPQTLVLVPRASPEGSRTRWVHYHEAFRVAGMRLTATRDLQNPSVQGMRVSIGAAWEPRLAPISITQPLDKVAAVDDQGNVIPVENPEGRREAPVHPGMSQVELELPLALPQRGATSIASLRGELQVLVPGRVETFEFDGDLTKQRSVEQRRAGVTLILEEVRKNVDLYQLRLRVRFDEAAGALESHRGWIFNNEAYLVGADGQRLENVGLETTRQERNEVGVAYLFDAPDGLEGYKFVYRTPALIIQTAVPYDLQDLPLP